MMIKVVKQIDDEVSLVYKGTATWNDQCIIFSDTVIMVSDRECLLKRKGEMPLHLIFELNKKTIHTVITEFGKLQLNAFTTKIHCSDVKVEIDYQLENQKHKLIVERIML